MPTSSPAIAESRQGNHAPLLDWLRFFASLTVLVTHVRATHWVAWGELDLGSRNPASFLLFAWGRLGYEAVVVFFVLSGYLVGGACWRRAREGVFKPGAYATDRASRLYLAYIPALLLSVAADFFLSCRDPHPAAIFLGNAFHLQIAFVRTPTTNPALWSLAYEAWFYVLAGGAAAAFGTCGATRKTLALLVCLLAAGLLIRSELTYLVCWLLGAAAAILPSEGWQRSRLLGGFALAAFATAWLQLGSGSQTEACQIPTLAGFRSPLTVALALGLMIAMPALARVTTPRRLAVAGARLAAFSFSLYLVHMPILALWNHVSPDRHPTIDLVSLALFAAKILVCLLVAWLFHLAFEAPLPAVRAWLTRTLRPAAPPSRCAAS